MYFIFGFLYILFYMNKIPPPPCSSSVFLLHIPPHFFPIFLLPLGMPIDSEIMDRFWHSRCLNDHINLFYMIGSFASGANVSLVAKNGTKKIIPLLWIKSSRKPQIKNFHKTDPLNYDLKYNFEIFKNKKSNSKKTP